MPTPRPFLFLLLLSPSGCHVLLPLEERPDARPGDRPATEARAKDLRSAEAPLVDGGGGTACGKPEVVDPVQMLPRSDRAGAVLPDGTVHTAYGTTQGLRHATNAGGGWAIEVVDALPDAGRDAALAVDGAGTVHVLYHAAGEIRWARRQKGKTWITSALAAGDGHASLAAHTSGLHGCYRAGGGLWYVSLPAGGAGWSQPVEVANPGGWDSSLAVDGGGIVHIAHGTGELTAELRHSQRSGGVWQTSEPRPGEKDVGVDVSVASEETAGLLIVHHEQVAGQPGRRCCRSRSVCCRCRGRRTARRTGRAAADRGIRLREGRRKRLHPGPGPRPPAGWRRPAPCACCHTPRRGAGRA